MSEHTKGRLSVDGALLRAENNNVVVNASSRPRLWEGDLRRLAACWNACIGFDTELLLNIEMMGDTLKQRFEGMQAEVRRVDAREAAARTELTAARALLREALETFDDNPDEDHEIADRMRDYLNAADGQERG